MPLPIDPISLIHPDAQPPHNGWGTCFAPYRFAYLAGFQDLCLAVGFRYATTLLKYVPQAKIQIPKSWAKHWPSGEWSDLSNPQVRLAFRGEPMRFDKAAMSIVVLEQALRYEPLADGVSRDVALECLYSGIKIAPAVYVVDGFEKNDFVRLSEPDLIKLKAATLQKRDGVFLDLAGGHPVTHYLAERIVSVWPGLTNRPVRIDALLDRSEARGKKATPREEIYLPHAALAPAAKID